MGAISKETRKRSVNGGQRGSIIEFTGVLLIYKKSVMSR